MTPKPSSLTAYLIISLYYLLIGHNAAAQDSSTLLPPVVDSSNETNSAPSLLPPVVESSVEKETAGNVKNEPFAATDNQSDAVTDSASSDTVPRTESSLESTTQESPISPSNSPEQNRISSESAAARERRSEHNSAMYRNSALGAAASANVNYGRARFSGMMGNHRAESFYDSQAVSDSMAALIFLLFQLGEEMGQSRRERTPVSQLEPAGRGSAAARFFTCDGGVNMPAGVGWCHMGSFYGPVHVGFFGTLSVVDNNFVGVGQLAAYARVSRNAYGLVQGFGVNDVHGQFIGGAQIGLGNIAGSLYGIGQFGLLNTSGKIGLLQVGVFFNDADKLVGFQISPFLSTGGDVFGFALGLTQNNHNLHAGVSVSMVDEMNYLIGLSVSPILSMINEEGFGIQLALISFADKMNGLSVGAIADVSSKKITGLQLGLVNYTRHLQGVQIGLVNVAQKLSGLQIGGFNGCRQGGLPFMIGLNLGFYRSKNQ
ncbi:MAG: hypothetical protein JXX29_11155 [Deltaproteobacteria bacterium]|nr:hypothetical protein [Deltaproteobacteria bacterium]MBN2672228.1 hypothetical protein [Deltaproteobacteria bacterium]